MAGLTVEQAGRAIFEAYLCQPPHAARMMEHAGRYVGRLDPRDKDMLLEDAIDRLWESREQIQHGKDVLIVWIASLDWAARRRPRWKIWIDAYRHQWVRGAQLGR